MKNFYYLSTSEIKSADAVSGCSSLNEIKVNVGYTAQTEIMINGKSVSKVLTPGTFGSEEENNLLRYIYDSTTNLPSHEQL